MIIELKIMDLNVLEVREGERKWRMRRVKSGISSGLFENGVDRMRLSEI